MRLWFMAALAVAGPALAQSSAVVDEGTLSVTQKGLPLGRESFRIVRAPGPGGQVYRATAQIALGDDRINTTLGTDSLGVPVSYEAEAAQKGQSVQRIKGRGRPGRFSVLITTTTGESAREYLLERGALLLDENVFHQFFFILLARDQGQANAISPRIGRQMRFQLERRGSDSVEVAGRLIPSQHFALTEAAGVTRELWVDGQGRILKVVIAERGLVALRDDPPR
ncbi:MAG TPA: hypothetical protein VFT29_01690 [Gemmatimonadaceae bacterium]|nr:hypothetical protein [Gemmatimonadaceae bacterium]